MTNEELQEKVLAEIIADPVVVADPEQVQTAPEDVTPPAEVQAQQEPAVGADPSPEANSVAGEPVTALTAQDVAPGSPLDLMRQKRAATLAAKAAAPNNTRTAPQGAKGKGQQPAAPTGKGRQNVTVMRAGKNLEQDATPVPPAPPALTVVTGEQVAAGATVTPAMLASLPKIAGGTKTRESRETKAAKPPAAPRTYVSDTYRPLIDAYATAGTLSVNEPEVRHFGDFAAMNGDQLKLARPAVAKWALLLGDCAASKRNESKPDAIASAKSYQAKAQAILELIDSRLAELGNGVQAAS